MLIIWTSKVRKPWMPLEIVCFVYWPTMLVCVDIERHGGEFGMDKKLFLRLALLPLVFYLAWKVRTALAALDDKRLSAHLQGVIWAGGLSALTPIAYVSMKGSSCVLESWSSPNIDGECGGVVEPLLGGKTREGISPLQASAKQPF